MIEVIYDKDKEKDKQESNEKNEHEVSVNLRLPKNIRQIGSPDGHKRIYMEDYVVTYLNYIARPGSTQARGAILLGESKKSDAGDVIFISGAVDAQNMIWMRVNLHRRSGPKSMIRSNSFSRDYP